MLFVVFFCRRLKFGWLFLAATAEFAVALLLNATRRLSQGIWLILFLVIQISCSVFQG
jgi:hypothetical protein